MDSNKDAVPCEKQWCNLS